MITDKLYNYFCTKDLIHYGCTHRPSDCYANPEIMVLQSKFLPIKSRRTLVTLRQAILFVSGRVLDINGLRHRCH